MIVEERVLLTFYYAQQYLPGLSDDQVEERLLGEERVRRSDLRVILENLEKSGWLERSKNGLLSLKTLKGVNQQRRDLNWMKQREDELRMIKEFLEKKTWCLALVLTGAQTFKDERGDIDLMVITKKDFLWQGRVELLLWAATLKKKRVPRQKEDSGWCFNLWLSEDQLALPSQKKTIFSAYECLQARWLFDKGHIKTAFLKNNIWIKKILANFWHKQGAEIVIEKCNNNEKNFIKTKNNRLVKPGKGENRVALIISEKCNNIKEGCFYELQKWYRRPKVGRNEIVNKKQAFFHPLKRNNLNLHEISVNCQNSLQKEYWWQDGLDDPPRRLVEILRTVKVQQKSVVLVTGVFDLLHLAHRDFLEQAAKCGDILIAGVECDSRVKMMKGSDRPYQGQFERCLCLSRLSGVRTAFVLPENFGLIMVRERIMREINADILAVSSSSAHLPEKERILRELGGKMLIVKNHDPGLSTTQKIEKLKKDGKGECGDTELIMR